MPSTKREKVSGGGGGEDKIALLTQVPAQFDLQPFRSLIDDIIDVVDVERYAKIQIL